jgi:propanol-preferring alcohol dehydrogenase
LVSVANFTRRDAQEFLDLAASIPVRTFTDVYPLSDADLALQRLAEGRVAGAAVLSCG